MDVFTLILETSTPKGSLALFEGRQLRATRSFDALRGHNSKIYGPLGELLESVGERSLDRIVVGTGPGSYTGVRIAIAIADALALSHDAQLVGCCSFLGASSGGQHERYWVVGDARRQSWYRAEISAGQVSGEIVTEERGAWEAAIEQALAEGIPVLSFDAEVPHSGVQADQPLAECLRDASFSMRPSGDPVEPRYLAPPFITQPKGKGKRLS